MDLFTPLIFLITVPLRVMYVDHIIVIVITFSTAIIIVITNAQHHQPTMSWNSSSKLCTLVQSEDCICLVINSSL